MLMKHVKVTRKSGIHIITYFFRNDYRSSLLGRRLYSRQKVHRQSAQEVVVGFKLHIPRN